MTFELDIAGGAEVLKEMAAPTIAALAQAIAATAGKDAVVKTFVTDRAKATVTVPAEQQAKDGVLTRSLSAAGFEVSAPEPPKRKRRKSDPRHTADGVAI